jgi:hypothetical protein
LDFFVKNLFSLICNERFAYVFSISRDHRNAMRSFTSDGHNKNCETGEGLKPSAKAFTSRAAEK